MFYRVSLQHVLKYSRSEIATIIRISVDYGYLFSHLVGKFLTSLRNLT